MELTPISSSMIEQGSKLQNVGIAVLDQQLEAFDASGVMMAEMLDSMPMPVPSLDPNVGQNFNASV